MLEQLHEWGIEISAGQVNELLGSNKAAFFEEKDALLRAGLESSRAITVDDSGARHKGKNGYVIQISNEHFAWFESTDKKSRINFLELLRAGHTDYRVNAEALAYMHAQKLPQGPLGRLGDHPEQVFYEAARGAASYQWQ